METKKVSLYGSMIEIDAIDELMERVQAGEESALMEMQEEVLTRATTKVDGVAGYFHFLEDTVDNFKGRRDELNQAIGVLENKLDKYLEYVKFCMETKQTGELRGTFYKIVIPKARKIVQIVNQNELPLEYMRVTKTIEPKKKEIGEALKAGVLISGAKLIDGETTVQFKINK